MLNPRSRTKFDERAAAIISATALARSPADEAVTATHIAEGRRAFRFTQKQEEARDLFGEPQRHTMLAGGARSAKTFFIVRQIVMRALKAPGSRHAIFRFRANAVWATIGKDTLPKVMQLCFPGTAITGPHKDGYFLLPNGSEIWLAGLDEKDRVEKILGMEFATLFFNECSQIPYDSVLIALTRLAQVCPGLSQRAYYDLNPPGKRHWSNVMFIQKRDPTSNQPLPDPENYRHMFINPKDNEENLSPEFIRSLANLPARKRKRFFEGQYGDDTEGALWTMEIIEKTRRQPSEVPDLRSVVIAVDPSGISDSEEPGDHDDIGIVAFGLGVDGHGYVLADYSCGKGPSGWGKDSVAAFRKHVADHVTAEVNFGGGMVEYVIKSIDPQVPYRAVTASRGKVVRAEPVSSLQEQGLIHFVGSLPQLEDECCGMTTLGFIGEGSPNRVDAMVWGATDLMLQGNAQAWVDHYATMAANASVPVSTEPPKDVLPFHKPNGGGRPTINGGNELTEVYMKTLAGYDEGAKLCANPRCGKPVDGDTRVSDGISVWHVGCF